MNTSDYIDFLPGLIHFAISLIIFAAIPILWIGSCIWVMNDATGRGKPGCLVGLLVFLTWPLGILFWLIVRPKVSKPSLPPPPPTQ